jgi:hypothetical protein
MVLHFFISFYYPFNIIPTFLPLSVAAGPPWGSARELSLPPLTWQGDPPPPLLALGRVTSSPYSWSIAGTTVTSLLRGTGGFNHPRESLNPSLHTGGPRRGRSFRRRLCRWCRWHGSWSVEMTSYTYVVASEYVTARLHRHWGSIGYTPGSGYGNTSSSGSLSLGLVSTANMPDPDLWCPLCYVNVRLNMYIIALLM